MNIAPGGAVDTTVFGSTEIYSIFGHTQSNGTRATQVDFTAGASNVFTFSASGAIGCGGGINASFTPDGASGGMNVSGPGSGLSPLSGNTQVPLVGVFVNGDPCGDVAPSTLAFDAGNLSDLSPLLNQVFYIGDGRNGLNNAAGDIIEFTAPSDATALFLGVIDAFGFSGTSNTYSDNPGSFAGWFWRSRRKSSR